MSATATKTTYQGIRSDRSYGGPCQYHLCTTVHATMTNDVRWRATATYEEAIDPDPQDSESCFSATHSYVADTPEKAISRAVENLTECLSDDLQIGLVEQAAQQALTG